MARILTYRMAEALRNRKPIALFAQIAHPTQTYYFWTGVGTITWDGQDWTGVGKLGNIAPVQKNTDLAIQELTFSLSGVSPDTVTWLDSNVRNRAATVWLGCIDGTKVVSDPYQLLDVLLDYQTLSVDDSGNATVSLHALSGFYTLERSVKEVWSSRDQKLSYSTDTGFDLVDTLRNQEVKWTLT